MRNQRGYTLVELQIAIAITGILLISVFTIFTNYLVIITRSTISTDMTVDAQSLLRTLSEELRYGAGVRQSNTITDANGPGGGWNTSNTTFVVITAVPATDIYREYIIDSATGNPYFNELVYYRQGKTLYKRILANPNAAGNSTKTSCPPAIATSACPADKKLVENISTLSFNLYDQDNASITDPLMAQSIKINLTLSRDTFGAPLTLDASTRTTLRNNFQ